MFSTSRKKVLNYASKAPQFRYFSSFSQILKSYNPNVPLDSASTIPSTWYTSEEFHQMELEHVWKKSWLCVDSFLDFKKVGDYRTGEIVDQPYIIVNTEKGIKAHHNVCLHHGAVIENKAQGNSDQFQCNYHGWTYSIEGQLIKCSAMKTCKNFLAKENRLKPINTYHFGNLFFANFEESSLKDTSEFEGMLKTFEDHHKRHRFDPLFRDYEFVAEQDYCLECNWKVFVDNWLDGGYHVPFLHKQLTKEVSVKEFISTNYHKTNYQEAPGESERIGDHLIYSFLYPNTMISTYRPWIDVTTIKPLGAQKCMVKMKWLVSKALKNNKKFIEESLRKSKEIQAEDVFMSEQVQRGMRSLGFKTGRYSPIRESGLYEFHKALYNDLSKAL